MLGSSDGFNSYSRRTIARGTSDLAGENTGVFTPDSSLSTVPLPDDATTTTAAPSMTRRTGTASPTGGSSSGGPAVVVVDAKGTFQRDFTTILSNCATVKDLQDTINRVCCTPQHCCYKVLRWTGTAAAGEAHRATLPPLTSIPPTELEPVTTLPLAPARDGGLTVLYALFSYVRPSRGWKAPHSALSTLSPSPSCASLHHSLQQSSSQSSQSSSYPLCVGSFSGAPSQGQSRFQRGKGSRTESEAQSPSADGHLSPSSSAARAPSSGCWNNTVPPMAKSTVALSLAVHINGDAPLLALLGHYAAAERDLLAAHLACQHPLLQQRQEAREDGPSPSLTRQYFQYLRQLHPQRGQLAALVQNSSYWEKPFKQFHDTLRGYPDPPLLLSELRSYMQYTPGEDVLGCTLTEWDAARRQQLQRLQAYQESAAAELRQTAGLEPTAAPVPPLTPEAGLQLLRGAADNMEYAEAAVRHQVAQYLEGYCRAQLPASTSASSLGTSATTASRSSEDRSVPRTPASVLRAERERVTPRQAAVVRQHARMAWFAPVEEAVRQRRTRPEAVYYIVEQIAADPNAIAKVWYDADGDHMQALLVMLQSVGPARPA